MLKRYYGDTLWDMRGLRSNVLIKSLEGKERRSIFRA